MLKNGTENSHEIHTHSVSLLFLIIVSQIQFIFCFDLFYEIRQTKLNNANSYKIQLLNYFILFALLPFRWIMISQDIYFTSTFETLPLAATIFPKYLYFTLPIFGLASFHFKLNHGGYFQLYSLKFIYYSESFFSGCFCFLLIFFFFVFF